MITPNTSESSGQPSRAFNVAFTSLSRECKATQKALIEASATARKKRESRIELVLGHIKGGHQLSERQLAMLEPEEQAVVRTLQVVNDPELRKAATELKQTARKGLESIGGFFTDLAKKL
jgi:hypothetical protein